MENAPHVINTSMATNAMEGGYGGLDTSMDRNIHTPFAIDGGGSIVA